MAMKRWTTDEWEKLTTEQKLTEAATANVARYGTLLPPKLEQLSLLDRKCPKCGNVGPTLSMFGVRMRSDGVFAAQSHCKSCRGSRTKVVTPGAHYVERLPSDIASTLNARQKEALAKLFAAAAEHGHDE